MAENTECRWCGLIHGTLCPAVKAMDFDPYGNVIRVEFMTPMDARPLGGGLGEPEAAPGNYPKLGEQK